MTAGLCAVIPARAGSVGIPGKNIAACAGKPLIGWTIEAALKSDVFERVIVSTDSAEIAEICRSFGAGVPFLRPPEISTGNVIPAAAALHALQWMREQEGYAPDRMALLQPTSPLRTADDIRNTIDFWDRSGADACIGVCPSRINPAHMMRRADDGTLTRQDFLPVSAISARQTWEIWHLALGQIYCVETNGFLEAQSYIFGRTVGFELPEENSLDVDTPWDLYLADLILRDRHGIPK